MKSRKRILNYAMSLLLAAVFTLSGILGFAVPVQAASSLGTITVCAERFSIGQGYLIEPYTLDIQQGDTYADICRRVLEQKGYSYTAKESPFYLSGIHGAEEGIISIPSCIQTIGPKKIGINTLNPPNNTAVNEYAGNTAWLGEFSYSRMSGWMYSVGNDSGYLFPGVGMDGYVPKDGDVFRLQFTVWGYGEDLTGCNQDGSIIYYEVADKTALTRKIARINQNKENWFVIEGCEAAYNNAIASLQKLDATQAEINAALAALPEEEPVFPDNVILNEQNVTLAIGDTLQLTAEITPDTVNQKGLSWMSSDPGIVSVDQNGLLTAKGNGEADVTVSTQNGKTAVCHVTVKVRAIEKIELNMSNASMEVQQKVQIYVKSYQPENATETLAITYASSNETVAIVDNQGIITAVKSGTADITVMTKGGVSAVCKVLVGDTVELALAMEDKIDKLPEAGKIAEENAHAVMEIWEEYSNLSDVVKDKISKEKVNKLTLLKKEADIIFEKQKNIAAANQLLKELPALSVVSLEHTQQIQEARDAYDALTIDEKGKVDENLYARLLNLERQIEELKKEIINVQTKIREFSSSVTIENVEEAVALWNDYSELSQEQKSQLGDSTVTRMEEISEDALACIESTINDVHKSQKFDLHSQMLQDFVTVSNVCEEMNSDITDQLPQETQDSLENIREWIRQNIQTSDNISISAGWFVRLVVKDAESDALIENAVKDKYSSLAKIILNKEISYEDIRTGKTYKPEKSQEFSVNLRDVGTLDNPKADTVAVSGNGNITLKELTGKYEENILTFKTAHTGRMLIVDNPIKVTGITVPKTASVGIGSSISLTVEYKPVNATVNKELKFKSSDASVVQVDENGKIKGMAPGTADITVSLKANSSINAVCRITVTDQANTLTKSVDQVMQETSAYMLSLDTNPAKGSEWFVLGLARSGKDLNAPYFTTYYNHIANYLKENNGKLTNTALYTEYSKMILVMTAIGKDPRDVAGYNLFSYLSNFDNVTKQGINGPIWALIAVNAKEEYDFPKVSGVGNLTTKQKLLDCILNAECSDGGWTMQGDNADPDITGMALQALAPYYNKNGYQNVTAAMDRAINRLSTIQNGTGGYSTMNAETSESCAQVLTGLCAAGIDPMTDARFIKDGHWLVENLISYHIGNSGFMHVKAGAANNGGAEAGTVNGMATEQAYYALTAYKRFTEGKTSLYDMSDMTVKEGGNGDNSGTGLENSSSSQGNSQSGTTDKNTASDKTVTTGKTTAVTAGGISKSASTKSVTSSKASGDSSASAANDETFDELEEEKEEGSWSFDGEEYQPDTGSTDVDLAEKEENTDEVETSGHRILSLENVPYVLCVVSGIVLLFFCIWMIRRKK